MHKGLGIGVLSASVVCGAEKGEMNLHEIGEMLVRAALGASLRETDPGMSREAAEQCLRASMCSWYDCDRRCDPRSTRVYDKGLCSVHLRVYEHLLAKPVTDDVGRQLDTFRRETNRGKKHIDDWLRSLGYQ
jgi:hypothetical protein